MTSAGSPETRQNPAQADEAASPQRGPLRTVIVADDLSGALDAAAPFAARGFTVAVATSIAGIAEAGAADVVAVSTGSRHLSGEAAAERVWQAAKALVAHRPGVVIKKIDSRLKGNLEAETIALAEAFGRTRIVVAPALPAQGRIVADGAVRGAGVAEPIDIRTRFGTLGTTIEVPETPDQPALDAVAQSLTQDGAEVIAAGARGLSEALARLWRDRPEAPPPRLALDAGLALVIASRDPITLRQMDLLIAAAPALRVIDAPDGALADGTDALNGPVLFRCTEASGSADPGAVAERFAATVAPHLGKPIRHIIASGGDTAAALTRALGIGVLRPRGEMLPGIPWSECRIAGDAHDIILVTKSGGFGEADCLCRLAGIAATEAAPAGHKGEAD
jgi:uncharacterized protein YgbK (DUF1537 family)